ncbi:MAG: hypothetical protein ACK5O2_09930 [Microthrixaceae bacterium]
MPHVRAVDSDGASELSEPAREVLETGLAQFLTLDRELRAGSEAPPRTVGVPDQQITTATIRRTSNGELVTVFAAPVEAGTGEGDDVERATAGLDERLRSAGHAAWWDVVAPQLDVEVARVVQPGGLFVASDSVHSADLEVFHEGDNYLPIDPDTLGARLEGADFHDVVVRTNDLGWAAVARA